MSRTVRRTLRELVNRLEEAKAFFARAKDNPAVKQKFLERALAQADHYQDQIRNFGNNVPIVRITYRKHGEGKDFHVYYVDLDSKLEIAAIIQRDRNLYGFYLVDYKQFTSGVPYYIET